MKQKIQEIEEGVPMQTEEVAVEETFQESDMMTSLLLFLSDYGVTEDQIEAWKNNYGNIYISQIHEDGKAFLWKKLNRAEYRQIIESGAMSKEMSYQDAVLRKCMLAPKPSHEFLSVSDAGLIPTLFTQIMFQSGFIPEQLALSLITEI